LAHIRSAVNGRNRSPLAFTEPVEGIVKDLLDFHLTGTQASNILAVLFAYYAFKFPSFIDQTAGVKPVQEQIDYLINLASTINRDRHRYDLGSYAQLSYLGMLWADTALLMAKQLAKQSPTENLSRWFERRALYADEFMVHELMPSLTHPITLVPFGFTEYQRACAVGIINPKGLYVGAGEIGYEPIAPEEVWPRMQVYSASCDRLGTGYGAYEDSISPALEEHLSGFLLTMRLGQSRG
jgi:hypothetical protein